MMRKLGGSGYTIVETLVFLVVSAALFISVATLIAGQQSRNEFNAAIREFESTVQDILNDVATGYYTRSGDIVCSTGASGPPTFASGTPTTQGRNSECIFIGKALQFSSNTSAGEYSVHNIAGRRSVTPSGETEREVANIQEAQPRIFGERATYNLASNLVFERVIVGASDNYGIALVNSFGQTDPAKAGVVTGASGTTAMGLSINRNVDQTTLASSVSSLTPANALSNQRVLICIGDQGPGGRRGAVTIDGRGTQILLAENVPTECPS